MSNEFSTPKLTPADNVKIPGVDGNNDSGYLLSEEVKDYMVGGLYGTTPEYSTLETYTVGQRVKNEGDLYRCTTAVAVPEVFDPTKWMKVDLPSLDERVSDNQSAIGQNTEDIATNSAAISSLITQIWVNSNPTSNFDAQSVQMDLSAYSFVIVYFRERTSYELLSSCIASVGVATLHTAMRWNTNALNVLMRKFTPSPTQIIFDSTYLGTTSSLSASNDFLVPISVWGIKSANVQPLPSS